MVEVDQKETVRVEYDDNGVTTVFFDRPEKRNAMNPTLHREMADVVTDLENDARDPDGGTNVIVLTGEGDKAFCAGQDLEEYFLNQEDDPVNRDITARAAMSWARRFRYFPRLTIAAVNGYCFGGGLRVHGSCDLAYASDRAVFGLSEINFGKFPAGGSTRVPSRILPQRHFLYMSLTGEDIDAAEAERIHLVNKTVPHDELYPMVYELAEKVSEKNQLAIKFAKEVYWHQIENNLSYDAAIDYELAKSRVLTQIQNAEDNRAIEAFKAGKYRPGLESYTQDDIAEFQQKKNQ